MPFGIGAPALAASGSSSAPSRAISAAWPLARALAKASVKDLRQSRRRARSASVATWRQSRFHSWTIPAEEWTTLQAGSSRVASNRVRRIRCSLGSGPAPVHAEVRAGDRSGFVTAQEKRQRRDLFRSHEMLGRLGGEQHIVHDLLPGEVARLHRIRDLVLDELRPDIAWRDAVHRDTIAGSLQRYGLGEPGDAVFGGDIGTLVGRGHKAVRARRIDDASPFFDFMAGSASRVV